MKKIFDLFKKILSLNNYIIENKNSWYKRQENFLAEIEDNDLFFF